VVTVENQAQAEVRLAGEIETGRIDEIGDFLLEHLAEWGPGDLAVGALARRVFERRNDEPEEW
jgi:hypothetical protein